jgi:hypothetical protein
MFIRHLNAVIVIALSIRNGLDLWYRYTERGTWYFPVPTAFHNTKAPFKAIRYGGVTPVVGYYRTTLPVRPARENL